MTQALTESNKAEGYRLSIQVYNRAPKERLVSVVILLGLLKTYLSAKNEGTAV